MRVQSQPIITGYSNNNMSAFKSALLYSPRSPLHKINPVIRFMDYEFQRSLFASRKEWWDVKENLAPYLEVTNLNYKKDFKIIGWDINDGNKTKYLVVLHGLSHNITSLQTLYQNVIEKTPFAILAPEYKGFTHGCEEFTYPDPKQLSNTTDAAIKYLHEKGIKDEDICILGHSFGGYIAAKCGKQYPNLGGIYLVSSINTYKHLAEAIKNGYPRNVPKNLCEKVKRHFKILTWQLGLLFDTSKCLKDVKAPVNIIHAKCDKKIKTETAELLANSCNNLNSLNILEQGSHRMDTDKINIIVSLLNKQQ